MQPHLYFLLLGSVFLLSIQGMTVMNGDCHVSFSVIQIHFFLVINCYSLGETCGGGISYMDLLQIALNN